MDILPLLIIMIMIMIMIMIKGLSLLRGCLDELPKERKATIAGDMGELKRELREKVIMGRHGVTWGDMRIEGIHGKSCEDFLEDTLSII